MAKASIRERLEKLESKRRFLDWFVMNRFLATLTLEELETWASRSRMPVEYIIDKERRLVISTAWGRATFAEARAHQERLKDDPDFHPEFNQFLDATDVTA